MKTSELPVGSVIKFKSPARIHIFYDRHPSDWSDFGGSLKTFDINPGDIVTIIKTSEKDFHVGQTILVGGITKVIYYRKDTWFDNNLASLGNVDLTVKEYYYDVISP